MLEILNSQHLFTHCAFRCLLSTVRLYPGCGNTTVIKKMSYTANPSPEDLATAVRQWVHFDNVAENLNKQLANIRALRNEYEAKVLELMARQNLQNTTLRVTGATLHHATRSKSTDLSWSFLEEQLHEYFRSKNVRDDTSELIAFLHRHRGGKTIEYLKKTPIPPSTTLTVPTPVTSGKKQ